MGIAITKPRVIVCEGEGDRAFFSHLIQERGLPEFDIFHPAQEEGVAGGVTGYKDFLVALSVPLTLRQTSGVLIVADNDVEPNASFGFVQQQIRDAAAIVEIDSGSTFGVPVAPMQVARGHGLPPIVVMMFPWTDDPGNLETICLDAVYAVRPDLRECIDSYCLCSHTSEWDISKQSKMRLECLIASLCRSKPSTALRYAWSRPESIIPLGQASFDRVADVLRGFDELVA
jgi:hypothetical protein